MAKIDKRKVSLIRLNGEAYPSWDRKYYYRLMVGNYKYILTKDFNLIKVSEVHKHSQNLLFYPLFNGPTPRYYTIGFSENANHGKISNICINKGKAILYAKEPGLQVLCQLKIKFFPEKDINFSFY
jgi:hypothetical protein